jgi:hypothetical protein
MIVRRFVMLLTLTLLVACSSGTPTGVLPSPDEEQPPANSSPDTHIEHVVIVEGDLKLKPGSQLQLTATIEESGRIDAQVTWASSAPGVASITPTGQLTALAPGITTITAAIDGSTAIAAAAISVSVTMPKPWQDQFEAQLASDLVATETDNLGRIIVTGTTEASLFSGNNGLWDVFVRVYNEDGTVAWQHQFGSSGSDSATQLSIDGNNRVIISGVTSGTLFAPNRGSDDIFVRVYNPDGSVAWSDQFGSNDLDLLSYDDLYAQLTLIDAFDRIIIAGVAFGDIFGTAGPGWNGFVVVYNTDGTIAWSDQFTSEASDGITTIALDGNNRIVVAGGTMGCLCTPNLGVNGWDAFVRVYNPDGSLAWQDQFGSDESDVPTGLAIDSADRIVVAGVTNGSLYAPNLGGWASFIRVYNPDGTTAWVDQVANHNPMLFRGLFQVEPVLVDSADRVIISGTTYGTLYAPNADDSMNTFIRVYDPDGNVVWNDQFGVGTTAPTAVALDSTDRIIIAGAVSERFTNAVPVAHALVVQPITNWDGFVRVYNPDGTRPWEDRFGTNNNKSVTGLDIDRFDRIVVTGNISSYLPPKFAPAIPQNGNGNGYSFGDIFIRVYTPDGAHP